MDWDIHEVSSLTNLYATTAAQHCPLHRSPPSYPAPSDVIVDLLGSQFT